MDQLAEFKKHAKARIAALARYGAVYEEGMGKLRECILREDALEVIDTVFAMLETDRRRGRRKGRSS